MPEGDTIHRLARRIDPALRGRRALCVDIGSGADRVRLTDIDVIGVAAHGKTMFVELAHGRVLRVHLGMYGSWHRYAPDEPWRRSAASAEVVLTTERDVFVCFRPLHADLRSLHDATPAALGLGPDVLASPFPVAAVAARAAASGHASVAEALLDQGIASGIGNIYKCELLFVCRISPFAAPAQVGAHGFDTLYARACTTMAGNLERRGRDFGAPDGLWVYRREGRPCYACGATIKCRRHGHGLPRATWWCPACQASTPPPGPSP